MSFYIRKSVKVGPIRFNISKSGIGISSAIRGARISTGPRGTYVHMGRNGIYYRQRIDETMPVASPKPQNSPYGNFDSFNDSIPTAAASKLIESSNRDLIAQINSRIQQPTYAFLVGLVSIVFACAIASLVLVVQSSASLFTDGIYTILQLLVMIVAAIIGGVGLYLAWVTNQQEKLARTTTLQYDLDEETKNKFIEVQNAFAELAKSVRIWRVVSEKVNWDWKRNAGASSLIKRRRIAAGWENPPFLNTRIKVYGFLLDTMQLFFLPDQVFVYQSGKYGAVPYNSLQTHTYPTRFIESDGVPGDSHIVAYTWQYVRRDGGPDRRFANNRQIPIVQYGHIELSSQTGMNLHFQVSNLSLAQQFIQTPSNYINFYQSTHQISSNAATSAGQQQESSTKPKRKAQESSACSVLNVSSNASKDEIIAAYKKLAQQYHPDKVAGLAPEFRELAEKRMKDINVAYEELMRKFKE